jgi:hypothetical protein
MVKDIGVEQEDRNPESIGCKIGKQGMAVNMRATALGRWRDSGDKEEIHFLPYKSYLSAMKPLQYRSNDHSMSNHAIA